MRAALVLVLGVALALGACRKTERRVERTEPWLASASASSSTSAPLLRRVPYTLARSRIEFELPARQGKPKGQLAPARGELDVDLDDLSHTTGNITSNLAELELFGADGAKDLAYTTRALDWLELGPGVKADKRDTGRTLSFAISELDAGHLVAAPNGDSRVRRRELVSHWAVRGELSLHGVRAGVRAEASLTLVPGALAAGPPAELVIRSTRPLVVPLSTHDIRPRDERGVTIAKDLALLGDKIGSEAKVTFELVFVPRP